MDNRLKTALEFSNYRVSLFNQKENIKLKVDSILACGINGGLFKATPDLISFTKLILDSGRDSVVLIDSNGNPIEISDLETFHKDLLSKYFEATNYYYAEYSKLKKARSVKGQFSDLFKEE